MRSKSPILAAALAVGVLPVCTASARAADQVVREYNIEDFGARAGGRFDNAPIINAILRRLPAQGGVVVIPSGDFLIDSPLIIKSNFVSIRGFNRGWRSNVDEAVAGVVGPAGGSKLILGPFANSGIFVPLRARLPDGRADRITGLSIRDLMIQGSGPQTGQTGIDVEQDGDGLVIDDVSCINLQTGVTVKEADASRISDCLIAECRNCLEMTGGIQNMVEACHLGAQPLGVTCRLTGEHHLLVTGCEIFPDGASAIVLTDGQFDTVTDCVISGFYTGLIELQGDHNALLSDTISAIKPGSSWAADPDNRPGDWGLLRIEGNENTFSASTIYSDQPPDDTRINCVAGTRNQLSDLSITGAESPCEVVVDGAAVDTRVLFCAPAGEIRVVGSNPQVIVPIPFTGLR